jgi:hypothetical protein
MVPGGLAGPAEVVHALAGAMAGHGLGPGARMNPSFRRTFAKPMAARQRMSPP